MITEWDTPIADWTPHSEPEMLLHMRIIHAVGIQAVCHCHDVQWALGMHVAIDILWHTAWIAWVDSVCWCVSTVCAGLFQSTFKSRWPLTRKPQKLPRAICPAPTPSAWASPSTSPSSIMKSWITQTKRVHLLNRWVVLWEGRLVCFLSGVKLVLAKAIIHPDFQNDNVTC